MKTPRLVYCEVCGAPGHSQQACPLYRLNEQQTAACPVRKAPSLE